MLALVMRQRQGIVVRDSTVRVLRARFFFLLA